MSETLVPDAEHTPIAEAVAGAVDEAVVEQEQQEQSEAAALTAVTAVTEAESAADHAEAEATIAEAAAERAEDAAETALEAVTATVETAAVVADLEPEAEPAPDLEARIAALEAENAELRASAEPVIETVEVEESNNDPGDEPETSSETPSGPTSQGRQRGSRFRRGRRG